MIGGPASANEATRPYFQLPIACGNNVRMETGPTHDNYHNGVWRRDKAIDMYGPPAAGTAVLASAAGTVQHVSGSSTNAMYVSHGSTGWRTMYAHMSGRVANGTWVNRGQQISVVDNVGTSAAPRYCGAPTLASVVDQPECPARMTSLPARLLTALAAQRLRNRPGRAIR